MNLADRRNHFLVEWLCFTLVFAKHATYVILPLSALLSFIIHYMKIFVADITSKHFCFLLVSTLLFASFLIASQTAVAQKKPSVTDKYLNALLKFEPWAESVWHDYPAIEGAGYFGDGASGGNGGIRGTTGIAIAYAVLIREYPNAPEKARRLKHLQATLKFAEETHQSGPASAVATDGKKWGAYPGIDKKDPRIWQSAMWAGAMGFAASLVEKQLDPAVVAGCKRAVAAEADLLATIPPPSGYQLDSKGEENAWDTSIPALAAAWMPNDSRAAKWIETAKLYLANSYTVPADTSGAIKKWIKTQTLFPSFAMENHGFYHPSYQAVAGMSMGDTYLMAKFLSPGLSKELIPFTDHNVEHVWGFLKDIILDSGEMAFPSGLDWSLHSYEHISYLAYLSTHFEDPQAQWAEERLAKEILYRQSVNGDGRFVGESCPDGFYREAVEAVRIANAYLHHQFAGFPVMKGSPIKPRTVNYPDVGLLIHRTDKQLVTVSYGSQTMALVYPLGGTTAGQKFITSPNPRSLIGGRGKATMKNYQPTADGFTADLEMVNNKGLRSHVAIKSGRETTALVELPVDGQLAADWYVMSVENHPLTGPQRTLLSTARSKIFKERSGSKPDTVNSSWVNVDNWMGVVSPTAGAFIYRNASAYNRNGAAEDNLLFHPADLQSPRALIVIAGANADVTHKVAESVKLNVSGNVKLTYTDLSGKQAVLELPK